MSIQVVARPVDRLFGIASNHVVGSSGSASCQHISLPCTLADFIHSSVFLLQRYRLAGVHTVMKKYNVLVCRFIGCASALHHNSGILSGPVLGVIMVVQIWSANIVPSSACYLLNSTI